MRLDELVARLTRLQAEGYGLANTDVVSVELAPSEDFSRWNNEVVIELR